MQPNLKNMSYGESNERERSRKGFRTPLDIGMGLFYVVIGGVIMVTRSFGNVPIPALVCYVLGGMMVVGGCFRFYRGLQDILQNRKK